MEGKERDKRLTKEVLKLAANAESVEALTAALAEAKVEATPEEIKSLYAAVHKELNDDDLSKVTGGLGNYWDTGCW